MGRERRNRRLLARSITDEGYEATPRSRPAERGETSSNFGSVKGPEGEGNERKPFPRRATKRSNFRFGPRLDDKTSFSYRRKPESAARAASSVFFQFCLFLAEKIYRLFGNTVSLWRHLMHDITWILTFLSRLYALPSWK